MASQSTTTKVEYSPELMALATRAAETPLAVAEKTAAEAGLAYDAAKSSGVNQQAASLGQSAIAQGNILTGSLGVGSQASQQSQDLLMQLSGDQFGNVINAGEQLATGQYQRGLEDVMRANYDRNLMAQEQAINANAARAGAFGSSRTGIGLAVARNEATRGLNEQIATSRNAQFQTGINAFMNSLQARTAAATNAASNANSIFNQGLTGFKLAQSGVEGVANAPYTALNAYKDTAAPGFGPQIPNPVQTTTSTTKGGGGGLCFLTTATVEHMGEADDGETLTTLRQFRDTYMSTPEFKPQIKWYYDNAPKIVEAINAREDAAEIYKTMYDVFIIPSGEMIKKGQNKLAHHLYTSLVEYCINRSNCDVPEFPEGVK